MTELAPVRLDAQPVRRRGLSSRARQMLQESVPEETLRAYKREWIKFLDWCADRDVVPVPVSTDNLTNWVAERCVAGHSESIIKQGISAVVFFHDQHPLVSPKLMPDRDDAWRLVRHHRQKLIDSGWRPEQAATLTVPQLREVCAAMPDGQGSTLRDRVILTVGTAGYMRRSVLARLKISDIIFTDDGHAWAFVARDKADQRSKGHWRKIPRGKHAMSDPVAALREWKEYLAVHGFREGPLLRAFQRVATGEVLTPKPIHPHFVNIVVKRRVAAIGLEAPSGRKFTGHTVRATGATIAFDAKRPAVQIAQEGGWSTRGTQVHQYNRPENQTAAMDGLM